MTPSDLLFDAQRRRCVECGGPLTHPEHGRPRRYCDADCARLGKQASDRAGLTPQRLAAMRLVSARRRQRVKSRVAAGKAMPLHEKGVGRVGH